MVSNRQIVVLVSRALALTQAVYALVDAISVPERFIWLTYRLKSHSVLEPRAITSEPEFYSLILSILRLIIISAAATLFWRCGQRVSNWLLPESETDPENVS
jgi:hypothetical protein